MAQFQFEAKDHTGARKRGVVQAGSQQEALSIIRKSRLEPLALKVAGAPAPAASRSATKRKTRLVEFYRDDKGRLQIQLGQQRPSVKELIVFTKQFTTLIESGVPIIQAINVLAAQQSKRSFRQILTEMREDVENGSSLAPAMRKHPQVFDSLYSSLVLAGEKSGQLSNIMRKVAEYMEKSEKIKGQVKSAMMYPAIIVAAALGTITVLMVFVVPTFAQQFQDGGKELPGITQMVMNVSSFMQHSWHLVIGGVVGAFVLYKQYAKTRTGRSQVDQMMLKLPGFGVLTRKVAVGRLCSTMATMLSAGVPILDALEIAANTAGNVVIQAFIHRVRQQVGSGSNVATPLAEGGLIPAMVVSMVAVGESTGALDQMLVRVSAFYEEEVDLAIKGLLSMIEPVLIVIIGSIVGVIVVAMYLPIFDLGAVATGQ